MINPALVRPGDVLVITKDTEAMWDEDVSAQIEECLPGVKVIVIEGVTDMAVYRPDDKAQ